MCGIVSSASQFQSGSSSSAATNQPQIICKDDNFTVYRERTNPVSSKGHLIIVFNLHVPSLYTLSTSDLPLLVNIRELAQRLLSSLNPSVSAPSSPYISATGDIPIPTTPTTPGNQLLNSRAHQRHDSGSPEFCIGFITPPWRDNKIPVTDHLHAHAYITPADRLGWWRGLAYGPVAWYSIDDLIAEIREESSNNRVRSGTGTRPIDTVPQAGARQGTAHGVETTAQSIGVLDVEGGSNNLALSPTSPQDGSFIEGSSSGHRPSSSRAGPSSSRDIEIPRLRV